MPYLAGLTGKPCSLRSKPSASHGDGLRADVAGETERRDDSEIELESSRAILTASDNNLRLAFRREEKIIEHHLPSADRTVDRVLV